MTDACTLARRLWDRATTRRMTPVDRVLIAKACVSGVCAVRGDTLDGQEAQR